MKIKILKDVKWAISPSCQPLILKKDEVFDLESSVCKGLLDCNYAVVVEQQNIKAITKYENKAIKNIDNKKIKKKKIKKIKK